MIKILSFYPPTVITEDQRFKARGTVAHFMSFITVIRSTSIRERVMARSHAFLLIFLFCLSFAASDDTNSSISYDVFQYVDPLIGCANGGNWPFVSVIPRVSGFNQ
jgi:hypothetical protein